MVVACLLLCRVLIAFALDVKVRANVAVELRDNIEPLCSGASYPLFLAKLWPVFKTILKGDPVFTNLSFDQVRSFFDQWIGNCCVVRFWGGC